MQIKAYSISNRRRIWTYLEVIIEKAIWMPTHKILMEMQIGSTKNNNYWFRVKISICYANQDTIEEGQQKIGE